MSFLEAGGKVKTQGGWQKVFSNRYNAAMFLESFTDFFIAGLFWHWELGSPIEEGRFLKVVSTNLHSIVVIKNISCFFRVVFKDNFFQE